MTKAEKVSCGELARARGHVARKRSREGLGSPLQGEVLFAVCFLSSLMSSLVVAGLRSLFPKWFPFRLTEEEVAMIRLLRGEREEPPYITDYERGGPPGPWHHNSVGRYSARPSINRLVKDLARPAACDEALDVLLLRIGDATTREWVVRCVQEGRLHRLRMDVRPRAKEEVILEAWTAEAAFDLAEARQAEKETVERAQGGHPVPAK